jgi:hypothetical protein
MKVKLELYWIVDLGVTRDRRMSQIDLNGNLQVRFVCLARRLRLLGCVKAVARTGAFEGVNVL